MPLRGFDSDKSPLVRASSQFTIQHSGDDGSLVEATLFLSIAVQRDGQHNVARQHVAVFPKSLQDNSAYARAKVWIAFQEQNVCFKRAGIDSARAKSGI